MKKCSVIGLLLVGLIFGLVGSVSAIPADTWYELYTGNVYGKPSYTPGVDLGYFIWADDNDLSSWHIRWNGDQKGISGPDRYQAYGLVQIWDIDDDYTEISFEESGTYKDISELETTIFGYGPDELSWLGYVTTHEDGLDFSILKGNVLNFNLDLICLEPGNDYQFSKADIFIGADKDNPESTSFGVPVVPEPASLLLLGSGLLGMAAFRRKKKRG